VVSCCRILLTGITAIEVCYSYKVMSVYDNNNVNTSIVLIIADTHIRGLRGPSCRLVNGVVKGCVVLHLKTLSIEFNARVQRTILSAVCLPVFV